VPASAPLTGKVIPCPGGGDTELAVDPVGRLYFNDLSLANFSVARSDDQGKTFPQHVNVVPPPKGNWGDRDFITAGPHGLVYLTWDYAPTTKYLRIICAAGGSCSFAAGELNAVIQRSANYGRTLETDRRVSPTRPAARNLAPLIGPAADRRCLPGPVGHQQETVALGRPRVLPHPATGERGPVGRGRPVHRDESTARWWIDGATAGAAAEALYLAGDTQAKARDTGWLSYSANGGKAWSAPVRVTPDSTTAPHIVQSAGGARGIDYVGWLSDSSPRGYAQYLRVFQVGRSWLDAPVRVSGSSAPSPSGQATRSASRRCPAPVLRNWC
jgi:hypothetical protein